MEPARYTLGMLTTGYPHRGDPVSGAFVRGMALSLARRGHAVRVLCAAREGDSPVIDPGVTVTAVRYFPPRTFHGSGAPDQLSRSPWAWLGAADFVPRFLLAARRWRAGCDALVSHFILPCGAVAGLVRGGRPHLAVVHGTDGRWLARLPLVAQRAALRGATGLRFTHNGLRRSLPDVGVPWEVRPMGFDPAEGEPARRGARGAMEVVSVGRLVPVKGLARAIEAVGLARARGAEVTLVVAGDGPERSALTSLASRWPGAVRFEGAVDARRRDGLLLRAEVFLHTAREGEGAPVAVLEAMGAGLPVVALDSGGVGALVGEGGVVVGSTEALVGALVELAWSPERRATLGARARERAWPLRWEAEGERLEGWLRGAVGPR